MLRLEYLLLVSKVTLLALGKLREDFDCSDGVAYEGFCFDACPSSFFEHSRDCKPLAGTPIFDLNSSKVNQVKEFLGLDHSDLKLLEKNFPILTSNQGYFFKKNSKFSFVGPQIFSYKMTISMFIYLVEGGNFVSDSEKILKLSANNSIFSLAYFGRYLIKDHFFNDLYQSWKLFHMKIEFLPRRVVSFNIKFGDNQVNRHININTFPDLDD